MTAATGGGIGDNGRRCEFDWMTNMLNVTTTSGHEFASGPGYKLGQTRHISISLLSQLKTKQPWKVTIAYSGPTAFNKPPLLTFSLRHRSLRPVRPGGCQRKRPAWMPNRWGDDNTGLAQQLGSYRFLALRDSWTTRCTYALRGSVRHTVGIHDRCRLRQLEPVDLGASQQPTQHGKLRRMIAILAVYKNTQ